jgi:Holliday junction resolvasome RuvABC endonuclease subunit
MGVRMFIDVGLNNTAILIEKGEEIIFEFIKNTKKEQKDKEDYYIDEVQKLIIQYKDIELIRIEDTYVNVRELKGIKPVVFAISQWKGLSRINDKKTDFDTISPSTVKKFITGKGIAKKEQVQYIMENKLQYDENYEKERQAIQDYYTRSGSKRKSDMEHLQDSIAIRDTYYLMKEKEENERG